MTSEERKLTFVHAIVCQIYNEMNWVLGFFKDHGGTENTIEGFKEIVHPIDEAYLAIEKAHTELDKLMSKHTVWEDNKE